jgi:molybdenum cofactor cytidylyltransferase
VIAAVVLAAGQSSRLGRPKQLVAFDGRSLIRRAVEAALEGGCAPVIAVLGASAREVRQEVEPFNVHIVVNENWRVGMAGSIRTGMAGLAAIGASVEAVVLLGCDQPGLDAEVIRRLLDAYHKRRSSGVTMVASAYGETLGTPALFAAVEFAALDALAGDRGARDLLRARSDRVSSISWPEGARDVDGPEDLPGAACDNPDAAL